MALEFTVNVKMIKILDVWCVKSMSLTYFGQVWVVHKLQTFCLTIVSNY